MPLGFDSTNSQGKFVIQLRPSGWGSINSHGKFIFQGWPLITYR